MAPPTYSIIFSSVNFFKSLSIVLTDTKSNFDNSSAVIFFVSSIIDDGILLTEVFDDVEVDEVIEKTGAKLKVADNIRRIKYDD